MIFKHDKEYNTLKETAFRYFQVLCKTPELELGLERDQILMQNKAKRWCVSSVLHYGIKVPNIIQTSAK